MTMSKCFNRGFLRLLVFVLFNTAVASVHQEVRKSEAGSDGSVAQRKTTTVWSPKASDHLTWQWQLQDTIDTSYNVSMYDIDLFDAPQAVIDKLHADGRIVICSFSAGSYESNRPDWQQFFSFITTNKTYTGRRPPFVGQMADSNERWLDIRRIDLLTPIMTSRMALAASKKCDGVEPDNMDAYTNQNETGIKITPAQQLAYNRFIAGLAHDHGLSVGLKNDVDQVGDLVNDFDWALNEQCFEYGQCGNYKNFTNLDKAVFGVEYGAISLCRVCRRAKAMNFSFMKKKRRLGAWRTSCGDANVIRRCGLYYY